jgi:ATP adenylyltransferase
MNDERLWAPWRLGYIKNTATPSADLRPLKLLDGADPGCFLCRGVADTLDRENLIVGRGPRSVVVVNRYPYNNGHLLVAPLLHKASLAELDADEHFELQQQITRCVALLERHLNAEGFNIGLNLGRVAGAGLPGHLHWHIVPRWSGDVNFMPVVAGIHVIPQSLDELWIQLQAALAADSDGKPSTT